ncbi:DUF4143 domain-containing protein, partial [bacterium]|nr:DUF4143 domain-containing protein [bacterium]
MCSVYRDAAASSCGRFAPVLARGLNHGGLPIHDPAAEPRPRLRAYVNAYIREEILDDTLLGFTLEPWRRAGRRRLVETAKFYLFDVGVARALRPEMPPAAEGSDLFGRAFEHFLINEVRACLAYTRRERMLTYWRTHSGFEVDLIVGDMDVALEFKSGRDVRDADL